MYLSPGRTGDPGYRDAEGLDAMGDGVKPHFIYERIGYPADGASLSAGAQQYIRLLDPATRQQRRDEIGIMHDIRGSTI